MVDIFPNTLHLDVELFADVPSDKIELCFESSYVVRSLNHLRYLRARWYLLKSSLNRVEVVPDAIEALAVLVVLSSELTL